LVSFDSGVPTIYGWPLVITEHTPELSQRGALVLADLSQYLLCEREAAGVLGSLHLKYLSHEFSLKIRARVDGNPAWASPITPKSGQATQSPFVCLGPV
jgi:HK97 family phage major capsid protein